MKEFEKMLAYNREFVETGKAIPYAASKFPAKRTAIVTCMDTRLITLLPAALGIVNGDMKVIRNAGGLIEDPWDSSMRSLLIAIYELGVKNVMIIAHTHCGVQGMKGDHFIEIMKERGISEHTLDMIARCGIDLEKWLTGFEDTAEAVRRSVDLVKSHPLIPRGTTVTGYIFDTDTALLNPVC